MEIDLEGATLMEIDFEGLRNSAPDIGYTRHATRTHTRTYVHAIWCGGPVCDKRPVVMKAGIGARARAQPRAVT
jgi:hypothetical protein